MAKRPTNPATVTAILAGVFSLGIVGYLGYMLVVGTKPVPVEVKTRSYNTTVITKELDSDPKARSVFALTVPLGTETNNNSGSVPLTDGEFGKDDITKLGR